MKNIIAQEIEKALEDKVKLAKEHGNNMATFFENLQNLEKYLSAQDLDVLMHGLKTAALEMKEREARKKAEEEAAIQAKKLADEQKRREAAAKRAAARAEKKRLQHVAEVTAMDLPMDYVNAFADDERATAQFDNVSDGLMMSLDMLGIVDIEFIASVTGKDLKAVISELKGSIFQNPLHWGECFYKGWETADEYLSGNIMHKYKVAKEANEAYNGYFSANIKALESVMEPDIDPKDIYVTLGSPWVPTDIIDDFILHLLGTEPPNKEQYYTQDFAVRHDETTGIWEIPRKNRFREASWHGKYENVCYKTWGTKRMEMLQLMERTLNMKTISITDAIDDDGKIRVVNQSETIKALEKQEEMIAEFQSWVWKAPARRKRLQAAYCRKYGNIKKRTFNGDFLMFPEMNKDIELYPYQKNSVARIIFSPNTLLAHDVGCGKTYVMIAAGMELRRLGKSKKNLYVVPNNIVGQWESLFYQLYPQAKVLVVTNHNFNLQKRDETLKRIKEEDFDAIIMAYSCFDMLSLSEKYYANLYKERIETLHNAEKNFYSEKLLSRRIESVHKALEKVKESYKDNVCDYPFDELGINTLFVDEIHNYKNVTVETSITRVLGAGSHGSKKCDAMMDKIHCIQRQNHGGRIILATGTPITNSITDIFVMQKYLQEGEMEFLGIHNFDNWAGMFAQKTTEFEIGVDTNSYKLTTRFAKFCNVPELTNILSSIADFHKVEKNYSELPDFEGYTDSLSEGSEDFKDYLKDISNRADDIRHKRVKPVEDNMLKITSDGRKAALDMRLIDTVFGLDTESKVMRCAENIMDIYNKTRDTKGIQLVFCDISTPKEGFNIYDELKDLLVAMGLDKHQVKFVHDATTETQRELLFGDCRDGEVSVLIGSTFKMGTGVNVQKRLVAIHHLDVPWRPADMVQREGRILRQGNMNEKVHIYRYITKESFDAYSWQLLETKQRFISQILSGMVTERTGVEVDEAVLNYAEVKALAIGNPLIKERVEVANELDKLRILQADYVADRQRMRVEMDALPERIEDQKRRIENCKKDIENAKNDKTDYNAIPYKEQKAMREKIYNALKGFENCPEEKFIMKYRGFDIVVPAYMVPRKRKNKQGEEFGEPIPYVMIKANGIYRIEIESESGISVRLNNFIASHVERDKETKKVKAVIKSGLEDRLEKYQGVLESYEIKLKNLAEELAKEGGFLKEIQAVQVKLAGIDEELGLDKEVA